MQSASSRNRAFASSGRIQRPSPPSGIRSRPRWLRTRHSERNWVASRVRPCGAGWPCSWSPGDSSPRTVGGPPRAEIRLPEPGSPGCSSGLGPSSECCSLCSWYLRSLGPGIASTGLRQRSLVRQAEQVAVERNRGDPRATPIRPASTQVRSTNWSANRSGEQERSTRESRRSRQVSSHGMHAAPSGYRFFLPRSSFSLSQSSSLVMLVSTVVMMAVVFGAAHPGPWPSRGGSSIAGTGTAVRCGGESPAGWTSNPAWLQGHALWWSRSARKGRVLHV